jgi:hypothetical protein
MTMTRPTRGTLVVVAALLLGAGAAHATETQPTA